MNELTRFLTALDHELFFKINREWAHPILDKLMPLITNPQNSLVPALLLVAYLIYKKHARAVVALICCALAVGMADMTSTYLIKPAVHRDRPEFSEKAALLRVRSQGSPSFPSNHSANCFAVATYMGFVLPEISGLLFFAALAVAYSRVYVGVHYPADVLGGGFLGYFAAMLIIMIAASIRASQIRRVLPAQPDPWKKRKFYAKRRRSSKQANARKV